MRPPHLGRRINLWLICQPVSVPAVHVQSNPLLHIRRRLNRNSAGQLDLAECSGHTETNASAAVGFQLRSRWRSEVTCSRTNHHRRIATIPAAKASVHARVRTIHEGELASRLQLHST